MTELEGDTTERVCLGCCKPFSSEGYTLCDSCLKIARFVLPSSLELFEVCQFRSRFVSGSAEWTPDNYDNYDSLSEFEHILRKCYQLGYGGDQEFKALFKQITDKARLGDKVQQIYAEYAWNDDGVLEFAEKIAGVINPQQPLKSKYEKENPGT